MRHSIKKTYVDKDDCYVWFHYDKTGKVVAASIEIITGVYGDNALSNETYDVSPEKIYYEDADMSGISLEQRPGMITILRRDYYRWDKAIKSLKKDIYDLACRHSQPLQRPIRQGDVIMVEYDNPYDLDLPEPYDSTDILQILEVEGQASYTVNEIDLDRYQFGPFEEPREYSLEERDDIKAILIMNPALYDKLQCVFSEGASKIYHDIVERYK